MTKFEIRNNIAYASQMQFEVLHRALWVQQAQPQTVFDWKFLEKAARDPKMTAFLNHGVKAKMCETTPYVNSVGTQYIAARAKIQLACDSIRKQGPALSNSCIGFADGMIHPATEGNNCIAKSLLRDASNTWSTMVMRATPFPTNLFQDIHPHHQVLLSCKPHRPGYHQWRPAQTTLATEIRELQPDAIVECYLNAKYYHYDPVEILDLVDFNATVANLLEEDNIVTVESAEADEFNVSPSVNDNFKENPALNGNKRHKPFIPSGSNIINLDISLRTRTALSVWTKQEAELPIGERKVIDSPELRMSILQHSKLQQMVTSTAWWQQSRSKLTRSPNYCQSSFQCKRTQSVQCAPPNIKEALTLCQDRNLHQIIGSRVVRIQAGGGGEFNNQKLKDLCFDKNIILSFPPAHQPSSNGTAGRVNGKLKSRMLKQAHLEREWWSYAAKFSGHMMREKVLGRPWQYPLFGQLVGIWKGHDKDQTKSLDDRGAVGYRLDIDIWQSGTSRIMQDGIVVKGLAPKPLDPLRYHINPRTT